MGDKTVTFNFALNDKVDINNTSRGGTVTLCGIDYGGEHFLVEVEDKDGRLSTRWYRASQLTASSV